MKKMTSWFRRLTSFDMTGAFSARGEQEATAPVPNAERNLPLLHAPQVSIRRHVISNETQWNEKSVPSLGTV